MNMRIGTAADQQTFLTKRQLQVILAFIVGVLASYDLMLPRKALAEHRRGRHCATLPYNSYWGEGYSGGWGHSNSYWSNHSYREPLDFRTPFNSSIWHGVRSGELSNREARELRRNAWQIQRDRERYLSDGQLSRRERKELGRDMPVTIEISALPEFQFGHTAR